MSSRRYFWHFFVLIMLLMIFSGLVYAHSEDSEQDDSDGKIDYSNPVLYIEATVVILIILTLYMLTIGKKFEDHHKKSFFWAMTVPIILSSFYLGGHTVYENISSETGGPVHWHADYQIWACGERLDLVDPKFPKNKIGTPLLHEHNDDRMHVEGTVSDYNDITLGHYFEVIGGELYKGHLKYSAITGDYDYVDGSVCPDGKVSSLKVYVNGKKIQDYSNYILYPNSYVPPGDCIIVLFDDSDSEKTDKLCESWTVKGWNYDSYKRPEVTIGGHTWQ